MDELVQEVGNYLPIKIAEPRLQRLVAHHFSGLQSCVQYELFSSAFLHLHILYMVFVYLQLQRIADFNMEAFRISLIGFSREEKDILKEPKYPLVFSRISEKTVFRLFRLNNIDDQVIGELAKPVERRNNHSHASHEIECEDANAFEITINDYICNMRKLVDMNSNIYERAYNDKSIQALIEDDSDITSDDIESYLLSPNFFSLKELEKVCYGKADKLSQKIIKDYDFAY